MDNLVEMKGITKRFPGVIANEDVDFELRPGEIRHNCGGCHAHSQQPTLFEKTAAAGANQRRQDTMRWSRRIGSSSHLREA